MVAEGLSDQELVFHAYLPVDGPHARAAAVGLGLIWRRCRVLLGTDRPITGTGLPSDLPEAFDWSTAEQGPLAAAENRTADFQVILRAVGGVLAFSLVFAAPQDTVARRVRIGSAAPPGWIEFDRWLDQVVDGATEAFLGVARIYQTTGEVPWEAVPGSIRWDTSTTVRALCTVWEPPAGVGQDRRLVITAPPDRDAELSAVTWSDGGVGMPVLARYLMHAAALRYQVRVWQAAQAGLAALRLSTAELAARCGADPGRAELFDRLASSEASVLLARSRVRNMRRTAEILAANMAATGIALASDRAQDTRLTQHLDDTDAYLTNSADLARGILAIARTPIPPSPDPHTDVLREPVSSPPEPDRPRGNLIRMGFATDIVAYSSRSTPGKDHLQRRLAALVDAVLADIGVRRTETDHQGAGDGEIVFLPVTTDVQTALPSLVRSFVDRLAADNVEHTDRMRLRVAVDVGPLGLAALGFSGGTVVRMSRLLDSPPLRAAADDGPGDLALMVSDVLFGYVVAEGAPGLDAADFERHAVRVKVFSGQAWLWRPLRPGSART